jgi:hypothetical protein
VRGAVDYQIEETCSIESHIAHADYPTCDTECNVHHSVLVCVCVSCTFALFLVCVVFVLLISSKAVLSHTSLWHAWTPGKRAPAYIPTVALLLCRFVANSPSPLLLAFALQRRK